MKLLFAAYRRVTVTMEKTRLLEEIDRIIKYCKNELNSKGEREKRLKEAELLVEKYEPADTMEERIKNNRIDDIRSIRESMLEPKKGKKKKKGNPFFGKVEVIDFKKCSEWISGNKNKLQDELDSVAEFKNCFPLKNEIIKGMDIERYVIGTSKKTFCWYLEVGTPGQMGQQSSLDYYLYWSVRDKSYIVREGGYKKVVSLDEAHQVYTSLKNNIEDMISLVARDRISFVEEARKGIELPKANILMKILFLYYPEIFIGYYTKEYVKKIAAMVGENYNSDVYQSNAMIAQKVKDGIEVSELSASEKTLGFTVYLWYEWNDYIKKAVESLS